MISKIKGKVASIKPTDLELWVGGLCYEVKTTIKTTDELNKAGVRETQECQLFTILVIREKAHELWGFWTAEERATFRLLCSVNGLGTNTARLILSRYTWQEVEQLILREDIATISKAKGIGPKTAKRLILDLKDKLEKQGKKLQDGERPARHTPQKENPVRKDAIDALLALGYKLIPAQKAVNAVLRLHPDIKDSGQLTAKALKNLR